MKLPVKNIAVLLYEKIDVTLNSSIFWIKDHVNFRIYNFIEQFFPLTFFAPVKDKKLVGIPNSCPVHNDNDSPDEHSCIGGHPFLMLVCITNIEQRNQEIENSKSQSYPPLPDKNCSVAFVFSKNVAEMMTDRLSDIRRRTRLWYIRYLYIQGYWRFQLAGKRIAENGIFCFLGELFLREGEGSSGSNN